ncbi:Trm112 family protein [Williamsia sterculiae]|uniref:Uncharacterized conserved protein YbaR, Trm112 family n=1 Tax=Williamsia sterculiae TaxID=1344003 RepID=A0A1N7HGJ6_9NOCA|nr:Trm112 family protein [Williamsia sterculiae]SIS23912.1 Uncharacterized conserved protein YbaR, Trm112 family [Williamsia sterculiae]
MALDPALRERLVCPQDHGPLLHLDDTLYNPRLRVAYRIDSEGIPVMLISEARPVDDAEHETLVTRGEEVGGTSQE